MTQSETDSHSYFNQPESAFKRKAGRLLTCLLFFSWIPNFTDAKTAVSFTHTSHYCFIENKGQIVDQNGKPNPAVLYLLNTPGMNVQLRKTGFSYDLYSRQEAQGIRQEKGISNNEQRISNDERISPLAFRRGAGGEVDNNPAAGGEVAFHRIDFDLIGTDPNCDVIAQDPSPGYLNYYTAGTPENGITAVYTYSCVTYKNIYKNIDLEFASNPVYGFKYTFIIYPGGNPDEIQINISGAKEIKHKDNGLLIRTSVADVEENIPHTFFILNGIRTEIKSNFRQINENLYGITVNQSIPPNAILRIDPVPNRLWGTYFGGYPAGGWTDDDVTTSIRIDKAGNIVIAGYTSAIDNIATAGSYQAVLNGIVYDAYLAKFTPDGVQIWGTYFGGGNLELCYGCVTDSINNIFLTGMTTSPTNIATAGTFQPAIDSLEDAYIAKFDPDGFRIWGTYYGGNDHEQANSISIDPQCNIYVTGYTNSTNNMASPGAYQTIYRGAIDAFLAKFDSTGQRIWGTYYGGQGWDNGLHCSVDNNNHVLLCGETESLTDIASPGAHQITYGGGENDAFLVLFNENGQRQWGTYYGGTGGDGSSWCFTSNTEKIYLFGGSYSPNNISTPFSFQPVMAGGGDIYI